MSTSLQTGLYPEQLQVARKAQKKLKAKANSIQKSQLTAHVDVSPLCDTA